MLVRQIFDPTLAQYAYLVGCPATGEAAIIDPERDVDQYIDLARQKGLRLVAAIDTHIHADYLSGMRELAERGVKIYASDEGDADWKYEWLMGSDYDYQLLTDGDTFRVGNIEFEALHTPGHTPEHLSYLVYDRGSGAEEPIALASGDFVFVGDVGRPDLLETAAGQEGVMEPSARTLYQSLERFKALPSFIQVWPAHGAGSACGKALGDVPISTVGYELHNNASIRATDSEQQFVDFILSGQPEPPLYFARMKRDNKLGPKVLGRLPQPRKLTAEDVKTLAGRTDIALLDTRRRQDFFAGYVPGAILAEWGTYFSPIAGSYVEEDMPIYLVIDEADVAQAVRDLINIGLDNIVGYATPETIGTYAAEGGTLDQMEVIDHAELEHRRIETDVHILDVRGQAEYEARHVPGAQNIAHTRLWARLGEVPKDRPVLVHCASGGRSSAAASLLARHGYTVTNVVDLFANYRPMEIAEAVA